MKFLGRFWTAFAMVLALGMVSADAKELRFVVVSHGQASDPFWSVPPALVACIS